MHRRITAFLLSLVAAIGLAPHVMPQQPAEPDEQFLKAVGVAVDTPTLLSFFRQRALKSGEPMPRIEPAVERDAAAAVARLLAVRKSEGALEALLAFLPRVEDVWLEEELLISVGRLGVQQGTPHAGLLAALKDPLPPRRAAAVYVLGRRANSAQRALIRALLEDADPRVRTRAAEGLLGKQVGQSLLDRGPADDAILKGQKVAATEAALLEFVRQRTPDAQEQTRLAALVAELGALEYADRFQAGEALIKAGTPALAFLKPALASPDAELSRRARRCIEEIQRGAHSALPIAVVHTMARPGLVQDAPAAIRTLLGFVPFAQDEAVEEEVLLSLTLLSVRQEKVEPSLPAALSDPLPARRAAAAYVLGCVGTEDHLSAVRKLLADSSAAVQLRAAQGLLAARDKAAVPKLIALLGESPLAGAWRIEEVLNRLAGDQGPPGAVAGPAPLDRRKSVEAWQTWWRDRQGTIDLARAAEGETFLGLVTICEYDNVVPGKFVGQAWEGPRYGPVRLKVGDLIGPMDAQVLSNGRILVAENGANRVTERDRDGAVKWEFTIQGGNPICCQRLPNGNTFIAMYNQLLEVRPDKSEVYRFSPGPQFYIFGARKTRSGTVVCITAQGALLELDPLQGTTLRSINVGGGGWASVEPLPNGHFLVATMNNNTVREIDPAGKNVWSFNTIAGVFRATRLPNGNILVASMNSREVSEVDRTGAVRWKHTCQGRPWSVHYR